MLKSKVRCGLLLALLAGVAIPMAFPAEAFALGYYTPLVDMTTSMRGDDARDGGAYYARQFGPYDVKAGENHSFELEGMGNTSSWLSLSVCDADGNELHRADGTAVKKEGSAAFNQASCTLKCTNTAKIHLLVRTADKDGFKLRTGRYESR